MSTVEQARTRTRKPDARNTEIVLAALEERLSVAIGVDSAHASRIEELLDELRRSLRKGKEE
jgi:hypothetical protein